MRPPAANPPRARGGASPRPAVSGYWRIDKDRDVDVTTTRDEGAVEIWTGERADSKPQIDPVTDAPYPLMIAISSRLHPPPGGIGKTQMGLVQVRVTG